MPENVTIRDVARRAGVSNGTVSRVLNHHANVAPDLRERVLEAAEALGYRATRPPRGNGRSPATQAQARPGRTASASTRLGFLLTLPHLPDRLEPMSPFWASILHGAEAEATRHGAQVTYLSLPHGPAAYRRHLGAVGLDGVLLVGVASADLVTAAQDAGHAAVLVDNQLAGVPVDAVIFDYVAAGREATDQLVRAGHRAIGFVGGPLRPDSPVRCAIPTIELQAIGYRTALAYAGLPFDPGTCESCDLTPEGGYAAGLRLLARRPDLTAVFCAGDRVATGVMRAAREAGRTIPAGLSVTAVDDEHEGQTVPPLTTVRLDKEHLGAAAVRRLVDRLAAPSSTATTVMLPVDLVARGSVHRRHPGDVTTA
ncbi:substrate-binding domain-containing protein [Jiangella mangrovi]|uniref:LacI family transcriptional regulator n=1 Tax=Jiangella mangrovi TaxID=1524084 RepID=A0A7W9GW30_9ACTN|nr:LacI family transcriptional regulator [Jiangella mangrovi]